MFKKRSFFNNLLYLNTLYRGLALFFVLFTLLDVASSELCNEELLNFSFYTTENASSDTTSNSNDQFVALPDTNEDRNQVPSTTDDDCCFCCCSHWLPAKIFSIQITETVVPQEQVNKAFLLDSPPHNAYHPPRSL